MRRLSLAGFGLLTVLAMPVAATAADMPLKAAPPALPPAFSWTGFYLGGEVGGVWANGSLYDSLHGFDVSTSHDGFIGGADLGFDYQFNNFVLGVESNFDWTSLSATGAGVAIPGIGTLQGSANTKWITTVAGRFGLAYNQMLFYGKAGVGWVGNTATITNLTTGASLSASNTRTGGLLGVGAEWAFNPNWSAKIEYNYIHLDSWNFSGPIIPADTWTVHRNVETLMVGINYRFGNVFGAHY
jgi:outer membrane immunogenic protein